MSISVAPAATASRDVGQLDRQRGPPGRERGRHAGHADRRAAQRVDRRSPPGRGTRTPRRPRGTSRSDGSGRIALAHSVRTLPGVSAPSSVVRSTIEIAVSIAHAFAVVLMLRVASAAARASAPTWSTPGRPCRNRRSEASSPSARPSRRHRNAAPGARGWSPASLGASRRTVRFQAHRRPGPERLGSAHVQTTVVDHPIVQARLTVMRDERSSNAEFRAALRELATLLVYEATRDARRGRRCRSRRRCARPTGTGWPTRRCWCRCCGPGSAWPRRRSTCCRSRRWASSAWPATSDTHEPHAVHGVAAGRRWPGAR